jgi:hypothetical protein
MPPSCTWRLVTPPPSGAAAIAVIELLGDIDQALAALPIRPVAPGAVSLRSLAGIDEGIVARFSPTTAYLMPHAGPAVVRGLIDALRRAGIAEAANPDPLAAYPEATSLLEARMLAALARAASPLAIDLLLDQPRRWNASRPDADADPAVLASSRILDRLIHPPLVVALGRPNIGKSSLLNALAGRRIALVADEPGTTRDHVGVTLDLAGLVVRWIDTPGIAATPSSSIDAAAQELALRAAAPADLLLLCADSTAPFLTSPHPAIPALHIGLRADLGPPAAGGEALPVSIHRPQSLELLVSTIRDALVPPAAISDPGPWHFWSLP